MIEPKASTLYRLVHAVAERRCTLWLLIVLLIRRGCCARGRVEHGGQAGRLEAATLLEAVPRR